jgi:hypothetical protein
MSTELVKRIRALANKLLPVEVELSAITDATSSIITPEVVETFAKCGGDFGEAVPFWYVPHLVSITYFHPD